jgi:hypothetical protein
LARIYVKDTSGSKFVCCDYYESGFGYLFTNCGGRQVIIDNDKLNSSLSMQYRNGPAVLGFPNPLWNFTELDALVSSHCNMTYLAVDEYMQGNSYDVFLSLDLPW